MAGHSALTVSIFDCQVRPAGGSHVSQVGPDCSHIVQKRGKARLGPCCRGRPRDAARGAGAVVPPITAVVRPDRDAGIAGTREGRGQPE